jgi:hypothetical protein
MISAIKSSWRNLWNAVRLIAGTSEIVFEALAENETTMLLWPGDRKTT